MHFRRAMDNEGNRVRPQRAADQFHQRAGVREPVHFGRRVRLMNLAHNVNPRAFARGLLGLDG